MQGIHKIWLIVDPRRSLIALFGFLGVLALLIHFILLGSSYFNWLEGPPAGEAAASVEAEPYSLV